MFISKLQRTSSATIARRSLASHRLPSQRLPSLAILDDHLNTSAPHFNTIPSTKLNIVTFNNTIVPLTISEEARLVERLRPFDLISTVRERTAFPGSLLQQLPNLKVLLATGTQFEMFDLATAKAQGIAVVAAPGLGRTDKIGPLRPNIKQGNVHPTTQHTWALILALARNMAADDAALKAGTGWQSGLATGLPGLTLGVVGLGRLGAAVARVAHLAWGMHVICWSENLTQTKADHMAASLGLNPDAGPDGGKTFRAVTKEALFCSADVLRNMKQTALLINTSRAPLVNQDALLDALERGIIRGAALDVFDVEPLPESSPWRRSGYWGLDGRSKLITTPHMGYVDEVLMNTWYAETAENVERWLGGQELLHRLA
ncbi:hypothetical protein DE146DRAFT_437282 [Phaeosphaeria sp. MPI-PUGE-AT-0046c]|nr:hypothetical protein DE146DRAFT_437282 [Phaeosphaeria sp. MPI-PUGE-AT-0046c]